MTRTTLLANPASIVIGISVGTVLMWAAIFPLRTVANATPGILGRAGAGQNPALNILRQLLVILPISAFIAGVQALRNTTSLTAAILLGLQFMLIPVAFLSGRSIRNHTISRDFLFLVSWFVGGGLCSAAIHLFNR